MESNMAQGDLETTPKCHACGKGAESYTGITGEKPTAGDIAVCWYCGALSQYGGDPLTLRPLSEERLAEVMKSPDWRMVKVAQDHAKRAREQGVEKPTVP